jgi:hypothetical protein
VTTIGLRRREVLKVLVSALTISRTSRAEDVSVPPDVQAELVSKVVRYDRNFAARAGDRVRVLILSKSGGADSARTAGRLVQALSALPDIGGIGQDVSTATYPGATQIRDRCKSDRLSIVYLTDELGAEVPALAEALNGSDILTISAVAAHVPAGVVLGFDLVSGKPKLLVNLQQARRQNVDFKADLLKLAKVYE